MIVYSVGFTVKVKATTDVELGSVSKDSLDDSKVELNVHVNPLASVSGTYLL